MKIVKEVKKPQNVENVDLKNKKQVQTLLSRNLTKPQLQAIFKKIKKQLKRQKQPQHLSAMNLLKKQLRYKYSIHLSNTIIDKFIDITEYNMNNKKATNFSFIEKEIKTSLEEIKKTKYCINNGKKIQEFMRKPVSSEKRRRKNYMFSTMMMTPNIKSAKCFDQILIRERLVILKDYIEPEELTKFEAQIFYKVQAIDSSHYGSYSDKIKSYTVYDSILQKIFMLIQQNTKNIQIRQKYHGIYKKMKEEMVSIITNNDEMVGVIEEVKRKHTDIFYHKDQNKNIGKKNYFQLEKEKQDLSTQIQETLEGAKKHLKQAFLKRGRPDFAYQMELLLDHRKTPLALKRGIL